MPRHKTELARTLDADARPSAKIYLNAPMVEIVNRLLSGGLHGTTAAQVVNRLFCDGCLPHAKKEQP